MDHEVHIWQIYQLNVSVMLILCFMQAHLTSLIAIYKITFHVYEENITEIEENRTVLEILLISE